MVLQGCKFEFRFHFHRTLADSPHGNRLFQIISDAGFVHLGFDLVFADFSKIILCLLDISSTPFHAVKRKHLPSSASPSGSRASCFDGQSSRWNQGWIPSCRRQLLDDPLQFRFTSMRRISQTSRPPSQDLVSSKHLRSLFKSNLA